MNWSVMSCIRVGREGGQTSITHLQWIPTHHDDDLFLIKVCCISAQYLNMHRQCISSTWYEVYFERSVLNLLIT